VDTAALQRTWATVTESGDAVPLFFYSHLFLAHPETRSMFPVSMATQRDRLVGALGHVVSNVDTLGDVVPFLQQLGRVHPKL
jgi:hemoglobin-like flavoprotein